MTDAGASRRARRLRLLLLAVAAILIAAAALAIWYVFFRPAGPPPIGPGAPVIPGFGSPTP